MGIASAALRPAPSPIASAIMPVVTRRRAAQPDDVARRGGTPLGDVLAHHGE